MNTPIKNSKHALIKICKKILNTDDVITESHVNLLKNKLNEHLNSGMSPTDIKNLYDIEYTDFGMFLKKCVGISLFTHKNAVDNYYRKIGKSLTDEKRIYRKACAFIFDPYSIPTIPGYEDLLEHGMFHPVNNPAGMCRDHIISVEFGWRNKIDPSIISHPCNCQFLTNQDNITKNDKSGLLLDDLLIRISTIDMTPICNQLKSLPKTIEHKLKISKTNAQYTTITNGYINRRVLKSDTIPENFRIGVTRKK